MKSQDHQPNLYLKITNDNLFDESAVLIPIRNLLCVKQMLPSSPQSFYIYYKSSTAGTRYINFAIFGSENQKDVIAKFNHAIIAAIKGGEQQQYYHVNLTSGKKILFEWG